MRILGTLLLAFSLSSAYAAEIWSIGADDGNYQEFSAAGNYGEFVKNFPNDPTVQIGTFDAKTDWSYIHPGPADNWAGKKPHTFTIKFDLPPSAANATAYELILKGWGHSSSAPSIDVNLNGKRGVIRTEGNSRSDAILGNPRAAEPKAFSLVLPAMVVKSTGNVLKLTNSNGSWFIYDCVQFRSKAGRIEAIQVRGEQGIRKMNKQPARKIRVDYQGEALSQPAWLNVEYTPENAETKKVRVMLNPDNHFSGAEAFLPVDEAICDRPVSVSVVLDLQGRKVKAAPVVLPAERKWEIHLIHQTHLDIGYTDTQVNILERQVTSLKEALQYIEETKNYPPEARFKFHPEGMWAIEEFMKTATGAEKAAFIKAAQNRDIHIDGLYSQSMTGLFSDEELFELLGCAIRFGKEHGITVDSAMLTDIPGYTWGFAPVLVKNGVKYLTLGPNCGHRVGRVYEWGEKPFWWESPSGKERLLVYLADTGYHQFHGKPRGHRISEEEIFFILNGNDHIPRSDKPRVFPFDLIPIRYGVEGDNGRPNRVVSDVVKEWNEKFYYPKLILSRNSDFMRELEKRFGDQLPVVRGDYTPYWEDGAASTSEALGINRKTKEFLTTLETNLAATNPQKYRDQLEIFDAIWTDIIMFDEHTWGAHNSISQPDSDFVIQQDNYKQEYARRARRTLQELGDFKSRQSEKRGDFGKAYVDVEKGIIGNDVLTLEVDKKTGAIISLKRKGIDVDLVNPGDDGNAGLNDYLCIIGRDAKENRSRIEGEINISGRVRDYPGITIAELTIESMAPNCKSLVRQIFVASDSDSIQIMNNMDKEMERRPEGIFFGFPFNVPGGVWRVDTPWATVQVEKDQIPGACRNYYCVQRSCTLSNDEFGIYWEPVEAPLAQFAPILFTPALGVDPWREHIEPNGTIYSWVCNNHWETNYKAGQDGKLLFNYWIRPYVGKFDAAKAQQSLRERHIKKALQNRIVKLDNENVLITRLKPTRTESGLILRLYNPSDKPQTVTLDFVQKVEQLYLSNPLEERVEKVANTITIDPFDFITIRAE
ncbi:MAG: polysaccharide lyase family protein [Planctomycetaceae bacterium]|nr:polysaccharide lyase family protein [Planctomycetaceae bacterium]